MELIVLGTRMRRIIIALTLVIALLASYTGGFYAGQRKEASVSAREAISRGKGMVTGKDNDPAWLSRDIDFKIYWDVWKWVQDHYIDRPVAEPKLLYASLMGLVSGLGDPYSVFMEPQDAEEFNQELQGSFEGIGAEIGIRNNRLTVISPLAESPAKVAGLMPLDWIIAIDDKDTAGIVLEDAVRSIRGPRDTQVKLKIMREGFDEPRTVIITRDEIRIVSVTQEMKEGVIGVITITNFHADTNERFRGAVTELLAKNVRALVLDLRNNPGGYLNSAVDISSYWIDEGSPVVLERSSDQRTKEYHAVRNQVLAGVPTVVLTNRGSASASEIVAGALQDYGAAIIVGMQTFGKGSIQEVEEFSDGSAVKLTIARWLTPKERQIDKEGIKPDHEVEITEDEAKQGKDPQMEKAFEILKSQILDSNPK